MKKSYFILSLIFTLLFSCKSDDSNDYVPAPVSPVVFDISTVPYNSLSEYNFFEGDIKDQNPVYGVLPYKPINSLFTDYALKKRFVWMPDDVKATYTNDYKTLNFPTGTILIKTFYYNNVLPSNTTKIIETRLMIRKETEWIFANYIWNNDQTEALLDTEGSTLDIEWVEGSVTKSTTYRIPSNAECLVCHKISNTATPIGTKPQNINSNYSYDDGNINQLEKLASFGYLDNANLPTSSEIETVVNWKDTSNSLDLRARSYLDINCAHCHIQDAHCSYRPIRLAFNETSNPDNYGECIVPDENINNALTHIVSPTRTNRSVLFYRMNTTNESVRMPLIGRTILHEEGLLLMEDWINSLETVCP
ncbi:hypothetical protein [Pseudofulvibacter geojedonensis]|uniref:Repeat protein (TIGR03806 family) n=1 Tax=Pseudofulvibacter geojedonensis TaxID=1123758 RepID=A0ABW3I101_9FLAO